uniref:Uncharacterized protein n=1 Tax=Tanacetum cinerariifolium TaxID=118510 RepID=A0A6L2K714_TANCI|nr:hypothetical protein [Tanacetum cinerariifolium]
MRNKINLHTICDDSLLGTLKLISKTQDYQQYGALIPDDMINQAIKDSKAYKTYYDFATGKDTPKKARRYKKVASPSRIMSPVLEEEPAEKPEQARKPSKKFTTVPTVGVVIKDTPSEYVPKKKTPAKVDRGDEVGSQPKGPDEFEDKTTNTDERTGNKPGISDVPKYLSESENESWGDSGDDESNDYESDEVTKNDDEDDDDESDANDDKEGSDSEKTDFNKDENLNVNMNDDDEEEEHEEEYVRTPDSFEFNDDDEEYDELYKDVNVRSKVTEHEEVEKGDEEITDTTHESVSQEKSYEQVIEDAHVTLTSSHKTEVSALEQELSQVKQVDHSAQILAQIPAKAQAEKEKYIEIIKKSVKEIIKDEVKSQLPQILPKEVSDFANPVIQSAINESLENVILAKSSSQPKSTYEAAASLTEFELKKILLDKIQKIKSYRDRDNKDQDKDPPAGSDQGLTKRKTSRDAEPPRGSKSKETNEMPQDQGGDLGNTENQSNVDEVSKHDWFKKTERPLTPDRDWNASKQIDFRPPQTWISKMAKSRKLPTTFDELMSTPIDFSAYVLHNPNIENLT